jgi:hypothetical protein
VLHEWIYPSRCLFAALLFPFPAGPRHMFVVSVVGVVYGLLILLLGTAPSIAHCFLFETDEAAGFGSEQLLGCCKVGVEF